MAMRRNPFLFADFTPDDFEWGIAPCRPPAQFVQVAEFAIAIHRLDDDVDKAGLAHFARDSSGSSRSEPLPLW